MGHSDLDPPYMKDGPRMQEKTSDQTAAEAARHMPQRTTAMMATDALPQISSSNVMCRASASFLDVSIEPLFRPASISAICTRLTLETSARAV